jgi:peptidoglycan/LPS O-acetylase OafA/YrhL
LNSHKIQNNRKQDNRIESLDWLRWLMAMAILLFHLTIWYFYSADSSSFIGRLGIYGVSIFFILSGLSMGLVYNKSIVSFKTSIVFFIKRVFRIIPLMLVIAFIVAIYDHASLKAFLFTGSTIFGFIKPNAYIVTGAWSIGNEMVYYAFTPIVIVTYNKSLQYGNTVTFLAFVLSMFFSFFCLIRI